MFSGRLNLKRYEYVCIICKVAEGSCIDCDLKSCKDKFHVRCAIQEGLILSNEEERQQELTLRVGEWDCKIFCPKHTKIGRLKVQKL